ncbi:hypothetical protein L1887_31086 [Cichorium endivia]|nr:hypothetical protein L1887_31086 [Cichorium endivia]
MIQSRLALKPDGLFLAAILGGETLTELRIACTIAHMEPEKLFPQLDFSMQPPTQELIVRDLNDNTWTFRHIYRGQPKKHLLTTGWSMFVGAKRLKVGDVVLFIRDEKSQLLLGVRRENRQQTLWPSSVLSADSMHIGVLAAAAHAAANQSPFTIFYNPRACPSEFVIPLTRYRKSVFGTQLSVGMRFGMMLTEEPGKRRYMGTIVGDRGKKHDTSPRHPSTPHPSHPCASPFFTGFLFDVKKPTTDDTSQATFPFIVQRQSLDPSFSWILERIRMDNGSARKDAMDIEGDDRLSNLPDDVIHKILSFISIKDAIGVSVLSSRWRFIWTTMPYLNFENLIPRGPSISEFISNVLSHHNNRIQVSSLNLVLGRTVIDDESVTRILNCAYSHNVQQLTVTRSPGKIVGRPLVYRLSFIATPTWDLPALTTLHLHHIKLSDSNSSTTTGLFSKCPNLKNLFLRRCTMNGTQVLNICHPRLSNLILEYIRLDMELEEYVNVVAPQLKNLTIKWCTGKYLISAPELTSLLIEGFHPWQISTPTGFPCLEKVDLCMYNPSNADAHKIVSLLQHFSTAKLLILSLGILQRLFQQRKHLSAFTKLIPHQACAFANAKILKFITKSPVKVYLEVPSEIKNCDTCPSAIFPMVSDEEIKAIRDMASAQLFVKNLGLFLKECKANKNSNMKEPQVKKHWAWELQMNLWEMMARIKQSKSVAFETCLIMEKFRPSSSEALQIIAWLQETRSLFQCIEKLMTQLSTSKRAVMQPKFSSLCQDAAILTYNILGWMKPINDKEDALRRRQVQPTITEPSEPKTCKVYRRRRHKE